MPPTIADVAKAAGVSTATVSRVLNGNTEVNAVMAERVRRTVQEMAYRPSRVARSLRSRRSDVWALIISDIRNPFFTDMARGVEDVAYAHGCSLVLCNAEDDPKKESTYVELAVAERMAGVILAPASATLTDPSPLTAAGIAVVTVDRRLRSIAVDRVLVDNHGGAELAVRHLAEAGYRRIACISGPTDVSTGAERLAGYKAGLRAHRLPLPTRLIRYGDFHDQSGHRAMEELLGLPERPDAVFVANNLMTLGALNAITEAGFSVPDDIAVVGFDDGPWAPLLRPPLTTIAQPTYDVGAETARMLYQRISGYTGAARELLLSPQLRIRESSQPPRRR